MLIGQRPSEELFADAGRLAAEASSPVEDQRGPVDYKRHLADELTRRVLRTARIAGPVPSPPSEGDPPCRSR